MKDAGMKTTVVAFIIMPAKTMSYSVEALKGQAVMKQLRDTVTEIQTSIGSRIFDIAATYALLSLTKTCQTEEIYLRQRVSWKIRS